MYCKKCGAPLDDDALFCSSCGQKVQESTQTIAKNVGQTNKKTPRWIGIVLCAVLAIVVLGSLGESTSKTSGYNSASVKSSYSSSKSNYSTYSGSVTTPSADVSTEYQNALTKGLGQFTRNYTQTVKRAADNKRRYAPGWVHSTCLLRGFPKGAAPNLAHDFAEQSVVCYTLCRRCPENTVAAGEGKGI